MDEVAPDFPATGNRLRDKYRVFCQALARKGEDGKIVDWVKSTANVRVALLPESYREIERDAAEIFQQS